VIRADVPNKLDPDHLARWRSEYSAARARYVTMTIGQDMATATLRRLGFHSQALDVELSDWQRLRAKTVRK
jgi:hypothetical protein